MTLEDTCYNLWADSCWKIDPGCVICQFNIHHIIGVYFRIHILNRICFLYLVYWCSCQVVMKISDNSYLFRMYLLKHKDRIRIYLFFSWHALDKFIHNKYNLFGITLIFISTWQRYEKTCSRKIYKPSNTKTLTSVPRRIFIINVMYLPRYTHGCKSLTIPAIAN